MAASTTADDLHLMANLSPLFTGLPFVVWISVKGNARHDIRVKVSKGQKAQPSQMISVALRPEVRVIGKGELSRRELALLTQWIDRNFATLLAYWEGEIFTERAIASLKGLK